MTSRPVLTSAALLLALLAGCSPHRPATAKKPVAVPSQVSVAPPTPAAPRRPAAPAFRELNLSSLQQRVPVLTYHDVIASRQQPDAVWFDCTADEFEAQMRFLHDQGAAVITLAQLERHLTLGERLPDHAIVLTFDDSYQGVYDHAVPVLKRYGYPYAVFVHTDYVGVRKGRPKMSWDELLTLDRSGQATIASHTRSHPADLGLLTTARQDDELQGSKKVLEDHLGHPVRFLSYPNGKANAAAFGRARQAGYTLGFMEEWGPVEQSPGILALNRYIHIQLPRAWAETYGPEALPAGRVLELSGGGPATTRQTVAAGVRLTVRQGGQPSGQLAGNRRLLAADFLTAGPDLRIWLASHAAGGAALGPFLAAAPSCPKPMPNGWRWCRAVRWSPGTRSASPCCRSCPVR